jgi:iron(III) transport system ATP-binding protein
VAGLERPDRGTISVADRTFFDSTSATNVPANQRGLGMVFQSYAIWPHMSVFKNVSFPLDVLPRNRRPGKKDLQERVMRALEATELSVFADRPATKLSGGQQQRLALARALVIQPQLMLLDEPLSNLDAKLRENMRFELKRLQRELDLTAVYVTHDQVEALALSSRIAVMNAGKIEQIGKPREIYTQPKTQFVAEFIGSSNFIAGRAGRRSGDNVCIDTVDGPLWSSAGVVPEGTEVLVSLRPENLALSRRPGPESTVNELRATVVNRAFMGESVDHVVSIGKLELRVRANPSISIPPGEEVYVTVDPANVTLVPAE